MGIITISAVVDSMLDSVEETLALEYDLSKITEQELFYLKAIIVAGSTGNVKGDKENKSEVERIFKKLEE